MQGGVVDELLVVHPQHHGHVLVAFDLAGQGVAMVWVCLWHASQYLEVRRVSHIEMGRPQMRQGLEQLAQILLDEGGRGFT